MNETRHNIRTVNGLITDEALGVRPLKFKSSVSLLLGALAVAWRAVKHLNVWLAWEVKHG